MNSRASQKCLDLLWSRPSARLCGHSRVLFRSPVLFGKSCPQGYATATAHATTKKRPSTPKPPVKASSSRTTAPKAASPPKFPTKGAPTPSAKPASGTASTLGAQRPAPITDATRTTNQTSHSSLSAPSASRQAVGFGRGTLTKLKESAVGRRVLPGSRSKMTEIEEKVKEKRTESHVNSDKEKHELTEEEQIEQIDRIMSMSRLFPTADPWGQKVETLDVQIPYSVKPTAQKHYADWRAMRDQFIQNRQNDAKNATSMYALARVNGFPGIDLAAPTFRQRTLQWPRRVFQCQSLKPNAWIAPFRAIALETYKNLNTALAQKDDKTVKRLTTHTHQDTALRLLKKSNNPSLKYIWRFHREVTPTRVISIRVSEGYLAPEEPKFGNRMMVHALVRFDTEQSLEVYDKRGKAVHTPASGDLVSQTGKSGRVGSGNVAAERKRVTEYLVLEKRMWYDGPWTFREQLWEVPGRAEAAV